MSPVSTKIRALPAERCLAVLLDGDMVRLFRVGEESVEELPDPTAGKRSNGKRSTTARRGARPVAEAGVRAGRCRHRDPDLPVMAAPACDHVHRTADRVAALVRTDHIDRILAGGSPECVAELRRILRARLGGDIETLALPPGASAAQVGEAARSGPRAGPSTHEEEVLGELIDAVGRGLAALGPATVVDAVNDHRAGVLVLGRTAPLSGARCPGCGHISVQPAPALCAACSLPLAAVPDLLELLAGRVRELEGEVEHIVGPAADALAPYDGIAALLRYAFPGAGRACPWEEPAAV
jgi:hypothetical protein